MNNGFWTSQSGTAVILFIGALTTLYVVGRKTEKIADNVQESLDITSEENIFYQGVNDIGESITGNENFDLGRYIYDQMNKQDG